METRENVNFFEFVQNRTGMSELRAKVTMDSFGMEEKLHGTWSKSIYFEGESICVRCNDLIILNGVILGTQVLIVPCVIFNVH